MVDEVKNLSWMSTNLSCSFTATTHHRRSRGYEYILVISDYAMRYLEAIPLRKAKSKNIVREEVILFSWVGIPKEILTDQGTPFMYKLMADLCQLSQVQHLNTSVCHPRQTVSWSAITRIFLKWTLWKVITKGGRDRDLLFPYVLFTTRESPQASTGLTPFKLFFERQPQGLLDVAKEAWESQLSPYR